MHISLSRVVGGMLFGVFFISFSIPRWFLGLPSDTFPLWSGLGTAAMGIWLWPSLAENWATMAERRGPRKIDWSRVSWQNKFWLVFTPTLIIGAFLFFMVLSGDPQIWIGLAAYVAVLVVVFLISRVLQQRFPRPWPAWATSLGSVLYLSFIVVAGLIFFNDAPLDWPRLILAGLVNGIIVATIWAAIQRVAVRWVQEQRILSA